MKLLIIALFTFSILNGICQSRDFESSFFETTPKYGDSIIILNWTNLIKGLEMSNERFQILVESHYMYSKSENLHYANTSIGSPQYTVSKKTDEFQMTWIKDKTFSSFLKKQMKKSLRGETDGWYIYKLGYAKDKGFVINIMLRDQGDIGMVIINRRPNVQP